MYRKCLEPLNDPGFDWSLGLFWGGCPSKIRGHLGSKWLGSPPFTAAMKFGYLEGVGDNLILRGLANDHHGQIHQVSKSVKDSPSPMISILFGLGTKGEK